MLLSLDAQKRQAIGFKGVSPLLVFLCTFNLFSAWVSPHRCLLLSILVTDIQRKR
jgi:hypothetical protein